MSDELDPEISALLNKMPAGNSDADIDTLDDSLEEVEEISDIDEADELEEENFGSMFGEKPAAAKSSSRGGARTIHDVDLSKTCFEPIEKFINDTPSDVYNDPKYYKICLTGENQSAQRVHQILTKYLVNTAYILYSA